MGHPTLRLIRAAIGPYTLDGLQPGEWREVAVVTGVGGVTPRGVTDAPGGAKGRSVWP